MREGLDKTSNKRALSTSTRVVVAGMTITIRNIHCSNSSQVLQDQRRQYMRHRYPTAITARCISNYLSTHPHQRKDCNTRICIIPTSTTSTPHRRSSRCLRRYSIRRVVPLLKHTHNQTLASRTLQIFLGISRWTMLVLVGTVHRDLDPIQLTLWY
jgi:hypothetical protein